MTVYVGQYMTLVGIILKLKKKKVLHLQSI